VLLQLDADQGVLRETTARFLDDQVPVATLRGLRDDPTGFEADYWRRGAELGWTSLLVDEALGGGRVSDAGLVDLSLIAYEFGLHAAPGPLVSTNLVAAALSAAGGRPEGVLDRLLSGEAIASWCLNEPVPHDRLDEVALEAAVDGDEVVLDGVKRPVESAGDAGFLLVTGRTGSGLTQLLVPTDTPGISIEPMHSVDLTRRFAAVTFDGVRVPSSAVLGEVGGADEQVAWQLQLAAVLTSAESVGAMQRAFDMTVEWAFERYSFGRPLASYQELKHRFADMKTWLEASHAITDAAAIAVAAEAPNGGELAGAAKVFTGEQGVELAQDCVQIHGGIGVTFEHDLHLYLRRITLNRTLYGTPAEHRQRLGAVVAQRIEAA